MLIMEILEKGLLNTVLGMGTVFVVLIAIAFIISLFRYIPMLEEKFKKKNDNLLINEDKVIEMITQYEEEEEVDDLELIAVITAALTSVIEEDNDIIIPEGGLIVRSIKRVNNSKWQRA